MKRLDVWDGILAPPLFIEEVAAQPTEEFIPLILKNSLPPSGYSLYKQRESWITKLEGVVQSLNLKSKI